MHQWDRCPAYAADDFQQSFHLCGMRRPWQQFSWLPCLERHREIGHMLRDLAGHGPALDSRRVLYGMLCADLRVHGNIQR